MVVCRETLAPLHLAGHWVSDPVCTAHSAGPSDRTSAARRARRGGEVSLCWQAETAQQADRPRDLCSKCKRADHVWDCRRDESRCM